MMKIALIPTCFIAILFVFSCSKPCNCPQYVYNEDVTELQLMKQIVEVVSVNFSTGFEIRFLNMGITNDSVLMAHICQDIISPVRFLDDDAGYFLWKASMDGWLCML